MSHIPEGFHAVTPFLTVERGREYMAFLTEAFGATERFAQYEDNQLRHGEVVVLDCVIELGTPKGDFTPTRSNFHVFVPDPDAAMQRALDAGCEQVYPMTDHDYGERSGGVKDPWGNQWYIAKVIDPVSRAT